MRTDGPTPEPVMVTEDGSFCLTTAEGPGAGWTVEWHRDPKAKGDDLRGTVYREVDGRRQMAAEGMRSKALAEALADVLNGDATIMERRALDTMREQLASGEEAEVDPVAVAIHDLADAVRSTGKPKARGGTLPGPGGPGLPGPQLPPHHQV